MTQNYIDIVLSMCGIAIHFFFVFFFHSFWKHLNFMINTMKFSMWITNNNHFNSFNKQQFIWYHFICFPFFCFQMMFHSIFLVLFIFKIDISFLFHYEWFHIHISFSNCFWGDLIIQHFKFQNMSFIHFQFNQNEFCCWIKQHKTHFIIEINCWFNWIKEFEMEI